MDRLTEDTFHSWKPNRSIWPLRFVGQTLSGSRRLFSTPKQLTSPGSTTTTSSSNTSLSGSCPSSDLRSGNQQRIVSSTGRNAHHKRHVLSLLVVHLPKNTRTLKFRSVNRVSVGRSRHNQPKGTFLGRRSRWYLNHFSGQKTKTNFPAVLALRCLPWLPREGLREVVSKHEGTRGP